MLLISSQKGLVRVSLPTQNPKKILDEFMISSDGILTHRENSIIKRTRVQLEQYFAGTRSEFYVALDLHGTDFQRSVWVALCHIPFGQTRSYQDIAHFVGNPKAARAIGMANHNNPIPIIVPCHRVISKSGGLGGFADNSTKCLHLKQQLLDLEKQAVRTMSFEPLHANAILPI